MTLRGRLAWAFAAMLLIPVASVVLSALVLRTSLGMGGPPEMVRRAVAVLNQELRRDPAGLLAEGFERLAAALPPGVSVGIGVGDQWVKTTPLFTDAPRGFGPLNQTLFTWTFEPKPGQEATLVVHWSPRDAFGGWFPWVPVAFLGLIVTTLVVLTRMVGRSVVRPLNTLEAAARRLGEGDLEPGPLPEQPPEFRRVGTALDELRRRLKESLLERQALEEERRTWVAAVSHDLRTPLSVIRGYAEGLRDGVASTPEKQARYHEVILERAQQLERQVDDLFQWARWDWGEPRLRLQPLDLSAELTGAADAWSGAELEVSWTPAALPCPIEADAVALRRIFDNLARNAVHHAGPDPKLHVALSIAEDYQVTFRDEGPGIPETILPRVFERFFRGDPARNPGQGGGGLGLTIAGILAMAHGGSIVAANSPQGGAEFTLRLRRSRGTV